MGCRYKRGSGRGEMMVWINGVEYVPKVDDCDRYPMCKDQPAQIDCRNTDCRFHVNGFCINASPAITLHNNLHFTCWSSIEEKPEPQICNMLNDGAECD